ncbi:MAG: sodium:solute symporter family protein [Oscillospiraceae bacterium]
MAAIDLIFIVAYLAGMVFIGLYSNKTQKGVENYYVAGRKSSPLTIMCLWVSCWIGGASVIGTSTKGYDLGITAIWYVGTLAVGCLSFSLLFAERIKRIGDKLNHLTYPEFIESRYDSRARAVATGCTLLGMIGVTASQLAAAGVILNTLTNWGLGTSFLIATAVLVMYTAMGGYMAVVFTDWVQVGLLLLGVIIGVPFAAKATGGFAALATLPESYFDIGAWGWPTIIAFTISTVMSFYTTMDSYTRCLSAKTPSAAKKGGILAAIIILPIALCATYEGMAAKVLMPELPAGMNALTALILKTFPTGIKGLVIVGILAAIMSSADIAIITGSANITRDIYQRYINPRASEKRIMGLGFISSTAIGIVAALLAWYKQDIMDILLITFTILSAGLFIPTVAGFLWKRGNSDAAFYSMLVSTIIVIVWYLGATFGWGAMFGIDALWPGLLASALIYFPVSLLGKQSDTEKQRIKDFLILGEK